MLTMDNKATRFLARMGSRGTLGQAVFDWANEGNDFFAISADLAHASGFDRIIEKYPERFVDVGIAEQNLIGVSAGLAETGLPVIATSWAMFTSVRVADQVRNFMGAMQLNIKLIGMDGGFVQSRFSNSHSNPPDIAIMRAIPGITILSPCDGVEEYKAIIAALEHKGPVYIRLTGGALTPIVHKNPDFEFVIGKSITLKEGTDVAILSTGNITKNALDAAAILEEQNISTKVVDMHTIVPLDTDMLDELSNYKLIITVEEHLLNGGFGSAVAQYYADKKQKPLHIMMGINNCYPKPGRVKYIEATNGLTPEHIAHKIISNLT